eukprot:gnl/MRDRNA2_/MRDRNA2_42680_c0_seq1.p1 gnl/MRDRNA2_/MRDRNA2_42680_c0~~gnl/MRDRNA2_/MRDRNA2_42680_c0_seq1.p1  ORF type:complete len:552 (+),score=116.54 gnl/MRDRNA2_/MRDRNA2_42680_c0_seq1:125-1780(+)
MGQAECKLRCCVSNSGTDAQENVLVEPLCDGEVPGMSLDDGDFETVVSRKVSRLSSINKKNSVKEGGFTRRSCIATNTFKIDELYDITGTAIGQGTYGSVTKATNKVTGNVRAVKSIPKKSMSDEATTQLAREIHIMRELDHPNIIKLYETFEDAKYIYLAMELCSGGELFDRIVEKGASGFSERVAAKLVKQMVGAVFYMHEANIAHRDLKPSNFLVSDERDLSESPLKLIDFGSSKQFERGVCMTSLVYTPDYVAPEVLGAKGEYTELCDVWSLGVMTYILLSGHPPFYSAKHKNENEILASVKKGVWNFNARVWECVSEDAKDLISNMLVRDPKNRFTSVQAMRHKWLQDLAPNAMHLTLSVETFNNLQAFRAANKLKRAAVTVIAQHLSEAAIENLKDMFHALDKNNDGTISMGEMNEGIQKMGIEDTELKSLLNKIMQDVDSSGSGAIDYSEFLAAALDQHHYIQEEVCWSAFRVFDVDGNGKITKDELAEIMSGAHGKQLEQTFDVDHAEIEKVMVEVDKDGDEKIDFEEFLFMMRKHESRKSNR